MNEIRTAAIIPAFNEERTIGPTVQAALRASLIDSLIVIDDGSTDATAAEAFKAVGLEQSAKPALVFGHAFNRGKSEAVWDGFEAANECFGLPEQGALVLVDADMSPVWSRLTPDNMKLTARLLGAIGLGSPETVSGSQEMFVDLLSARIDQITRPVLENGAPMTIGMPQRNWAADHLRVALNWGAFGGTRAIKTEFFNQLIDESRNRGISISGWELEAALNTYARKRRDEQGQKLNRGIEKFLWDDVVNVGSRVKAGSFIGGIRRMTEVHSRAFRGLVKYSHQF